MTTPESILATHPDHLHLEGMCKPWLDSMGAPDPQQAADDLRAAGWRFTKAGGYYDAWVSPEGITFGTTMVRLAGDAVSVDECAFR